MAAVNEGTHYDEWPRSQGADLISLWWVPFILGLLGLGASLYSYDAIRARGEHGVPLSYASAVVVGPDIYIYDDWQRVRRFDRSGRELSSWNVEAYGGGVTLALRESGELEVFAYRADALYIYDPSGELLATHAMSDSPHGDLIQRRAPDPHSDSAYVLFRDALYLELAESERVTIVPPGPPISNPIAGFVVSAVFLPLGAGLAAAWLRRQPSNNRVKTDRAKPGRLREGR